MDKNFIRKLPSLRKQLTSSKLSVSDLVTQYKSKFESLANEILNEYRKKGTVDPEIASKLHDYLMICLDVYTYSTEGESLIMDFTYDLIMTIYCKITGNERMSQSDAIVSSMLWPFVKHEAPFMVGTINRKIYDLDELSYYLKQLRRDGFTHLLYAPKFDGVSAAVTIRNGTIERAVTRNNGIEGQDITEVIRRMNRAKKVFTRSRTEDGYYKCEIVMSTEDFENLCNMKTYKNRRSAASAIVSAPSNLIYAEFLSCIPLAWVNFDGTKMKYLASQYADGMVENPNSFDVADVYENIERILRHIRAAAYPIRTDGAVVFPYSPNHLEPNTVDLMANCLAYKINTQEGLSRVQSVYLSIGRTGMAKPMVRVEPVEVNEVFMKQASLGSMANFASLNLHQDEEVIVFAAGDIIPQIRMPDPRSYPKGAPRLIMDIRCPYCGKKLRPKKSDADLFCVNPRCPRVLSGRIANFVEKLDICEGFRDETFFALVQANIISTIEDLFTLDHHVEQVSRVLGSRLQAEKLFMGLKALKTKTFEVSTVFGSLGIEGISIRTCQVIFGDMNLEYLLELKKGRVEMALAGIPGIGPITAETFADWINENRDFIEFLMENMKIVDDKINYGTVNFTGFRNKDYAEELKSIGFPVSDRVTGDTIAVVYAGDVTTGNATKAINKGIPLVHLGQIDQLVEELRKCTKDLENREIEYGRRHLIKDIRSHVPCYQV